MYLPEIIREKNKEIRARKILSDVLKIEINEESKRKETSKEETIKFLSEQMIKEVQKAFQ